MQSPEPQSQRAPHAACGATPWPRSPPPRGEAAGAPVHPKSQGACAIGGDRGMTVGACANAPIPPANAPRSALSVKRCAASHEWRALASAAQRTGCPGAAHSSSRAKRMATSPSPWREMVRNRPEAATAATAIAQAGIPAPRASASRTERGARVTLTQMATGRAAIALGRRFGDRVREWRSGGRSGPPGLILSPDQGGRCENVAHVVAPCALGLGLGPDAGCWMPDGTSLDAAGRQCAPIFFPSPRAEKRFMGGTYAGLAWWCRRMRQRLG